ncbi:stringent starvation protein B [Acidovorax sp. CF316]|uniref:ClpXP protease specificity-enhancing factor n=1 Tax=Acidovorax sp. CF316 TaxID=1144317 RepID=UPI00026BCB34|nr:ClpXP protease specificity-enhancing factor [Acidovorax sp. CF316]EJE52641.1 stringent starvation protein B [Acidovorax sp. CF316]
MNATESTSTRPYLIRALYEWCTDNGLTPYVAVRVDDSVQVPREYVNDGEIVLNISYDATSALQLGNDFIEFKARFGGKPREILVPVGRVIAIYARENGQGMAFPPPVDNLVGGAPPQGLSAPASAPAELSQVPVAAPTPVSASPVDDRVVHLVPGESPASDGGDGHPPRPSPSGGGSRPALKRVK